MNALRRYNRSLHVRSFSGLDLLIILMSFVVCHYVYLDGLDFSSERFIIVVATTVLSYLSFAAAGLYRTNRTRVLHDVLNRLTIGWFLVILLVTLMAYFLKIAVEVSRVWFGLSSILAFVGLVVARITSAWLLKISQSHGAGRISVVLIGKSDLTTDLYDRLIQDKWSGHSVEKVFPLEFSSDTVSYEGKRLDESLLQLSSFVEQRRRDGTPVSEVWIALPLSEELRIKRIVFSLRDSSVDVCMIPDAFGMQLIAGSASNVADMPVINISDIRLPGSAELFKTSFDWVGAILAIILLSPVLLLIALAVKLGSPGPILFRQHRYGVDGKEIEVWKFRSMRVQENDQDTTQATRDDPRVTRLGAFLRSHSLDELPQFFNVLQGNMSIVGPRPHAVSHNEEFRTKIDGYMLRHKIKPGITGWAQVNGWRGETDTLEKMERRVRYDLDYIRNWSLWLDIKIILLTVVHVFSGKDAY